MRLLEDRLRDLILRNFKLDPGLGLAKDPTSHKTKCLFLESRRHEFEFANKIVKASKELMEDVFGIKYVKQNNNCGSVTSLWIF